MKLLKPKALKKGDVIGVVAPAYPFPSEAEQEYLDTYLAGCKELSEMGFKVKESPNLRKREWWRAGTPKERADDINTFYADPEVKAIIAHDGGNDCISVLEYLDYDLVSRNPKPFIGFSNITNIHSAFFSKTGLVGFHMGLLSYELGNYWQKAGGNVRSIGSKYFKNVLTSTDSLGELKSLSDWECWKPGRAKGMLFGGNLSMLDSLVGTEYFPSIDQLKGSIFFWELDNSATYRIERVLTHMKYIGLLDVISGMVVGKLVDMKKSSEYFAEPPISEMVLSILEDYSFPIIGEVDFGHKMVQLPMLVGLEAEIDADQKSIKYLESGVV